MDAAAIQALVQDAVQAALQGFQQQQQQQQVPPAQPVAVPYADVPGGAGNDPWDFTSGSGLKVFINSTKGLETKFDGNQAKLHPFLLHVSKRAAAYGWSTILTIPDGGNIARSLIKEYGTLSRAHVRAHAITYITQENRARQSSTCMALFIEESITEELLVRLQQREQHYADFEVGGVAVTRDAGAAMLFELISLVSIETRATVSNLLRQLQTLPTKMDELDSDIVKFNTHVNDVLIELRARRATVPDIVPHLFDAYKSCADTTFVSYMRQREEEYEDSRVDYTVDNLMDKALNKYKILEGKNEWKKQTEQELQFLAMRAEFEANRAKLKVAEKKLSQNKGTNQGAANQPRKNDGKFAWKSVAPKTGEPHAKTVNGKDYIYCPHHGDTKWVLKINREGLNHKENCRMAAAAKGSGATAMTAVASSTSGAPSKSQLRYAKALAHVIEQEDPDSSSLTEEI